MRRALLHGEVLLHPVPANCIAAHMLIPAFHRCETEAAIIGRIMGGFGELELGLGFCVCHAVGRNRDDILGEIFRIWNAAPRIDRAEALAITRIRELGLDDEFAHVLKQVRHCLQIRNNYSHCHWGDVDGRLFFTKLQESAKMEGFPLKWREINLSLLQLQEGFCVNTREWLLYLEHEVKCRVDPRRHNPRSPPGLMEQPALFIGEELDALPR